MDSLTLARTLHVLAVVIWIGGVSIVTTILLPAVRRRELGGDWLTAFRVIERRFVWQARAAIIVVGATGFYMIAKADLWGRFRSTDDWWMHAMIGLWTIFAIALFVVEPFFIDGRLTRWANQRPNAVLAALAWVHLVLLALSLITIFGAIAGSHGWAVF
jgi:uncharacterized membrane protein